MDGINWQDGATVNLVSLRSADAGSRRRLLLGVCSSFCGEVHERRFFCPVYLPSDSKAAELVLDFVRETVWGWIEGPAVPWLVENVGMQGRGLVDVLTHDRGVRLSTFLVAGGLAKLEAGDWTANEILQVFLRLGRPQQ